MTTTMQVREPEEKTIEIKPRCCVATVSYSGVYWTVMVDGETVWTGTDKAEAENEAAKLNGGAL